MNPIASQAEAVLKQHPHPALRISELIDLIADQVDRSLDATRLRTALKQHPDRFRVLDPWRGPWRSVLEAPQWSELADDGWVVLVTDPIPHPAGADRTLTTMRESVRWLARNVDPRSASEVSEWYAIVLAERATRRAIARRAA